MGQAYTSSSVKRTERQTLVQPPMDKWAEVRVGMTETEVARLLGPPLRKEHGVRWIVGDLRFADDEWLEEYHFALLFDHNQRVFRKSDPFGGEYRPDGAPSTPTPVFPSKSVSFDHVPRYIDLRWQPSSGEYPMSFEVQLDFLNGEGDVPDAELSAESGTWITSRSVESWRPGVMVEFVGANGGRWRVRARNTKGTSDWSAYSYFRFAK